MIITKHNIKTFPGRLLLFLAAAVCALNLSPLIVQADDIDDMLASGSYVEGEVIAAIMTDSSVMQAESDSLYEVTELISVDSSAVQLSDRDGETKKSGYSVKVTTSLSDNVNLCVVSSETMSTEELLRALVDDPNVVFAEPNYTLEMDSEDRSGELTLEGKDGLESGVLTLEGQDGSEGDVVTPEGQESSEGDVLAPEGQDISVGGEIAAEIQEDSQTLVAQPETGALGDLMPLQWGNWTTEETTRAEGMAENPSMNVPGFGSVGRNGNMDQQVVVAFLIRVSTPNIPTLRM